MAEGSINGVVEVYEFKPYPYVVEGEALREAVRSGRGVSRISKLVLERAGSVLAVYSSGRLVCEVPVDGLPPVRGHLVYRIDCRRGIVEPLAVYHDGYLQLRFLPDSGETTLVIDGLLMHRVQDTTPSLDAEAKVRAARVAQGSTVLDVCTGLGYTALAALRAGAGRVYSIELRADVLWLAQHNPLSWGLTSPRATLLLGDATHVIRFLREGVFDRVIHDPPRFNVAGDLYSLEFYSHLFRVLRPGGLLFHYTGEPMKRRGRGRGPVVRGVIERLRRAGFRVLGYDRRALGVVAVKPRRAT